MARSRKKSLAQNVVGVATTGMPQPVRKLLGGRIVALLLMVAIPALFATGVLSLKWEDGRPHLQFNQQRAAQVEEKAVQQVQTLSRKYADRDKTTLAIPPLAEARQDSALAAPVKKLEEGLRQLSPLDTNGAPPTRGPIAETVSKSKLRPLPHWRGRADDGRK